ncbi:hypothetical protein [Escherichia sp. E3659]|uniref:hypothetical protein n=1 Tax=Escherichia sp. E3659 TaxID=2044462 RepID=UPI001436748D|nr:hypothetical protein [Escherichia sp. E3659]
MRSPDETGVRLPLEGGIAVLMNGANSTLLRNASHLQHPLYRIWRSGQTGFAGAGSYYC